LGKQKPPQRIVNGYGPTETTTFATTFEIKSVPQNSVSIPIGTPIANSRIYILSEERKPVPIGATGEIYIGGAGVSRGYLNREALTEERFVTDPFSSAPGARLYRSGDLGRWRPDGTIEYLGRNDLQVKIRGFRIELGEVESVLQGFPGVRQAVAVAREEDRGVKRLIGYIVPELKSSERLEGENGSAEYEEKVCSLIEELREYLKSKLPPYMVPAVLVSLEEIPLTVNGKVDRGALPAPEVLQHLSRGYIAPAGPIEEALSELWKRALRVERVGVEDNFFELGGDSLLGIEVIGQVADTFSVQLSSMAIFQYPTIRELARFVDGLRVRAEPP
jgi:acyl-CoA synthetase (AMP-forming)/AMP-acid ligase II/acyl carrier protein